MAVRNRNRLPTPSGWTAASAWNAAAIAIVVCLLSELAGCRTFRGHKVSDESIAAARQLSLEGIDAQQRGHWERAETLFAAAIVRCPSDERARYGYAEALWRRGAWQQAVEHMEQAVRLSGNDPERMVRLGQMYRSRGDLSRAGQLADDAVAANGKLAAAWALRGQVLHDLGDIENALSSYHRALSYQQPLPDVQLGVARVYAQQNRPQRALATLQSLAATYPSGQVPQQVLVEQSLALRALGRQQDAETLLAQAAREAQNAFPSQDANAISRAVVPSTYQR